MNKLIPDLLDIVVGLEGSPVLQKALAALLAPAVRRVADHLLANPSLDQGPLLDVAGALGTLAVYANQSTKAVARPATPAKASPAAPAPVAPDGATVAPVAP